MYIVPFFPFHKSLILTVASQSRRFSTHALPHISLPFFNLEYRTRAPD